MIENLLVALLVLIIVIVTILIWLLLEHQKLKQAYRGLEGFAVRNSKDIAGLCSAAVAVDSLMIANDERFKTIAEKLAKYEEQDYQTDNPSQPYHSAIQKIHNGATAEELVRECGVSRDEAVLLIRLHARENKTKDANAT